MALTYPIPKGEKQSNKIENFRLINILPNINKAFEVFINKRIFKFFTSTCLKDLEKAFDTVWIAGLLYNLLDKLFPRNFI